MDWLDYREKLGTGFNDSEKVNYFFRKMTILLERSYSEVFECFKYENFLEFCNMTGSLIRNQVIYTEEYSEVVVILKEHMVSLEDFLAYYIAFANCCSNSRDVKYNRFFYYSAVKRMLEQSHIPYEIMSDNDGVFIFPKGAKELDDALVSQPLAWLCDYPTTRTVYIRALKEYAEATSENASDIADKFRKTLETFMQEFFGCEKTLENCKAEYGTYLKKQGVPKEIASNLESVLQAYSNFMNAYAKHHDRTGVNVLEYIMYQTGNIIRLLTTLRKQESGSM